MRFRPTPKYVITASLLTLFIVNILYWATLFIRRSNHFSPSRNDSSLGSLNIVTAITQNDQFESLEGLIGSIHFYHPELHTIVYSPSEFGDRINRWEQTEWRNISNIDPGVLMGPAPPLHFFVLLDVLSRDRGAHAVFIAPGVSLTDRLDVLHRHVRQQGHFLAPREGVWALRALDSAFFRQLVLFASACGQAGSCDEALPRLCRQLRCFDGALARLGLTHAANRTFPARLRDGRKFAPPKEEPNPPGPGTSPGATHICMLVPSTTRGIEDVALERLPFFEIFLPSFLPSVAPDQARFRYTLHFGYDDDDPYYPEHIDEAARKVAALADATTPDLRLTFRPSSLIGMQGAPAFIWNALFQEAIDSPDRCDYFYQINDDVKFESEGWATRFTDALRQNPVYPDFGMVGPSDHYNKRTMTQSFCSRVHHAILGSYYPPSFRNWWSDDWATKVYDPWSSTFWLASDVIWNTNKAGQRYTENKEAEGWWWKEVEKSRATIQKWLDAHPRP